MFSVPMHITIFSYAILGSSSTEKLQCGKRCAICSFMTVHKGLHRSSIIHVHLCSILKHTLKKKNPPSKLKRVPNATQSQQYSYLCCLKSYCSAISSQPRNTFLQSSWHHFPYIWKKRSFGIQISSASLWDHLIKAAFNFFILI